MSTAFNSFTKAVTGQNYKTKNASCVLGLTQASSVVSEPMSLATSANRGGSLQGLPLVSTTHGRVKALSAGTFAFGPAQNKWVMLGNNVCRTLSGTSNTILANSSAEYFRRPIAFKTGDRITFLDSLTWTSNSLSGCTYSFTRNATLTAYGSDTEAALSRTARGTAIIMVDGKIATEYDYKALTLF